MKRFRISDLKDHREGHFLKGVLPGDYLSKGGLSFKKPGERSHDVGCTCPSCDGKGRHVHADDSEVFILLEGKAVLEVDGVSHDMVTGDIIVCEPGEDHHLMADAIIPCVNLCLHASDISHVDVKNQTADSHRKKELS